jgi:hypothetical protein
MLTCIFFPVLGQLGLELGEIGNILPIVFGFLVLLKLGVELVLCNRCLILVALLVFRSENLPSLSDQFRDIGETEVLSLQFVTDICSKTSQRPTAQSAARGTLRLANITYAEGGFSGAFSSDWTVSAYTTVASGASS